MQQRTQSAEIEAATTTGSRPPTRRREAVATDYDDGLLATGIPIMVAAYTAALVIVAATFMASGAALFAIAICAVYGVMYFGVPLLMLRVRSSHDDRWRPATPERTADRVYIFGGAIRRHEAIVQMVLVPLGVVLAFSAFSLIWIFVRP